MLPFLLTGCTKESEQINDFPNDAINETGDFDPGRPVVFGERLDIPYTIENMTRAFNSLPSEIRGDLSVEAVVFNTHNYVKITFETDEQMDFVSNADIELFFIPMDLDVIQGGYYDDEGNADGTRVRYCVVTVGQMSVVKESGAEFEVLQNLFMPDEEAEFTVITRSGAKLSRDFITKLVRESYVLTGNESWLPDEDSAAEQIETRSSRPQGRIQYKDKLPNGTYRYIGMYGLKVKAVRLLKTATGICDANGYYTCDKTFNFNWRYETTFERYDFDINNGRNGSFAYVSGSTKAPWSFTIWDETSKGYFMSTIFRACHHYYYENIQGLRRPPENGFWKTKLKIAARFEDGDVAGNTNMGRRFLGLGNAIHIFKPIRPPYEIYGTVLHELAHASHWNMAKSDYNIDNDASNRVVESWAVGVSNILIKRKYPTYRGYVNSSHKLYTQVVIDIIDTEADHIALVNWGLNIASGDNVHGDTLRQIEDCLPGSTSFDKWRTKIYNTYPHNATRVNLNTLFSAHYK